MKAGVILGVILVAGRAEADPEAVTFQEALRRAVAYNTDLRIAIDDVARTEGLLQQARSALLPQVSGTAVYTRLRSNEYIAGQRIAAENSLVPTLDVAMPLVDLKAIADTRRAADQVGVNAANANRVKRDVSIETARAYFDAYTAEQYVEIAKSARDTARGHVDVAQQRVTAGVNNGLDVARAQSELATDDAQVAAAKVSQIRAEQALGVITGTNHALAAATEPDLGPPHAGPGIERRADVVAQHVRRDAASRSRRLDWTEWAPSLHVNGDLDYQIPALDPGAPQEEYEVQLTLSVPLFDGGFRRGLHTQRLALEAEEREREVGVERQATSDVDAADGVLDQQQLARTAAHAAAKFAARTLELAFEGYKAGTSSSLEVIDAQRAARDAALQALLGDNAYREAELDLLAATGAFP